MQIFNYFNYPKAKNHIVQVDGKPVKLRFEPCFTIHNKIHELFSQIQSGSTVRGSMYMWNMQSPDEWASYPGSPANITQLFIQKTQDTDTQLVVDGFVQRAAPDTLEALQTGLGAESVYVTPSVPTSNPQYRKYLAWHVAARMKNKMDFPDKNFGYMHNKFFLFSDLVGLGKNIVVQLSANLNYTQYFQYNSMAVLVDAPGIYANYMTYWETLAGRGSSLEFDNPLVFPRKVCPISEKLKELLARNDKSEIHIAMSFFTRVGVATLLKKLIAKGCSVKVILGNEHESRWVFRYFRDNKIPHRVIKNKDWQGRMHNKYMLVKTPDSCSVWTGSYNITHPGLRNNSEMLLRLDDAKSYAEYLEDFNKIWTSKLAFEFTRFTRLPS